VAIFFKNGNVTYTKCLRNDITFDAYSPYFLLFYHVLMQLKNICYCIVVGGANTGIPKNCYCKNHNVKKKFVVEMNAKICIEYIPHETKIKKAYNQN
jgi:hypothetical protein